MAFFPGKALGPVSHQISKSFLKLKDLYFSEKLTGKMKSITQMLPWTAPQCRGKIQAGPCKTYEEISG